MAASPTGAWASHADHIAVWLDGAWRFFTPGTGWLAWVVDEAALLAWNGSAWVDALSAVSAIQNLPLLGILTTADSTNRLAVKSDGVLLMRQSGGLRRMRTEKSKPLLEDLHVWLLRERENLSRSSEVLKPINYMLRRWDDFARFLDDGRICLTNNCAVRLRGRPPCVRRRHCWLRTFWAGQNL